MRAFFISTGILFSLALVGCGPGAGGRPGPLSTTIDEASLASVSIGAKKDMIHKQNDFHIAKAAFQKATDANQNFKHEEELAKNGKKKADIETGSAKTKVEAAKSSGDKERMSQAMAAMHSAQLQHEIADAHLEVARTQTKYLQSNKNFHEEKMFLAQARFELSKAELTKKNNLGAADFSLDAFKLQVTDRESRVKKAAERNDALQKEASLAKQKWQSLSNKAKSQRS